MNKPDRHSTRQSLAGAVRRVEAFLDECPGRPRSPQASVRYSAVGRMLLPGFRLLHPRFLPAVVRGLLRGKLRVNAFRLNRHCDSVSIKNNIRINRPDGNAVSVKICLPKAGKASLRNEIDIRRRLQAEFADLALTPPMLDFDNRQGNWIIEEYIGSSPLQAGKERATLESLLPEFYRRTVSLSLLKDKDAQNLLRSQNREILRLVGLVRNGESRIAYALCHGDLVRSNMVRGNDGTCYICDWEHARNMPVAFDLAKLYLRYRRCRRAILHLLETLSNDAQYLPARLQIALGIEDFLNHVVAEGGDLNRKQRRRDRAGRELIGRLLEEAYRDSSVGQVIEVNTVRVTPPNSLSVQRGRE